jgi:hypothetical protein
MIALLTMYPRKRVIHLFWDNARYHHAKLVQAWLARPGCRIRLRFIPTYCPHLDPIERLWGLMHKHITHNTCHETFRDFSGAILTRQRRCQGTGASTAMRSQTTSAPSRPRIFGFWRERGIRAADRSVQGTREGEVPLAEQQCLQVERGHKGAFSSVSSGQDHAETHKHQEDNDSKRKRSDQVENDQEPYEQHSAPNSC